MHSYARLIVAKHGYQFWKCVVIDEVIHHSGALGPHIRDRMLQTRADCGECITATEHQVPVRLLHPKRVSKTLHPGRKVIVTRPAKHPASLVDRSSDNQPYSSLTRSLEFARSVAAITRIRVVTFRRSSAGVSLLSDFNVVGLSAAGWMNLAGC